jgi:hypothetical protein
MPVRLLAGLGPPSGEVRSLFGTSVPAVLCIFARGLNAAKTSERGDRSSLAFVKQNFEWEYSPISPCCPILPDENEPLP